MMRKWEVLVLIGVISLVGYCIAVPSASNNPVVLKVNGVSPAIAEISEFDLRIELDREDLKKTLLINKLRGYISAKDFEKEQNEVNQYLERHTRGGMSSTELFPPKPFKQD